MPLLLMISSARSATKTSERGETSDDKVSEAAMEDRKKIDIFKTAMSWAVSPSLPTAHSSITNQIANIKPPTIQWTY